jgi:cell division protein FtsW (lipid II flippase)
LLVYVWLLVLQRTMGASLVVAILTYHVFFANKVRLGLLFLVAPAASVLTVAAIDAGISRLSQLDPETDGVRYKSGMMAWNSFLDYPFFGLGQQSFYTLTEQQLFWHKFYSSDLGLLGILFKYGAVGATIYIAFSIFLIQRMIRVNWAIKQRYGKINPTIFSLLVIYLACTLNIMLVPIFTYIPGITAAALGIALTSIWQHKLAEEFAKPGCQGADQRVQTAARALPTHPAQPLA